MEEPMCLVVLGEGNIGAGGHPVVCITITECNTSMFVGHRHVNWFRNTANLYITIWEDPLAEGRECGLNTPEPSEERNLQLRPKIRQLQGSLSNISRELGDFGLTA